MRISRFIRTTREARFVPGITGEENSGSDPNQEEPELRGLTPARNLQQRHREVAIGIGGNRGGLAHAGAGGRGAGAKRAASRDRAPAGSELRHSRYALDPSLR